VAQLNHRGAFATVEPTKGDMTDWVGKVFEPLRADIKERKKELQAKEKQKNDLYGKIEKIEPVEGLKVNSLQEILNNNIPVLMEQSYKFQEEARQAIDRGDIKGFWEANAKIDKLKNAGKTLRSSFEAYEKKGLDLMEGIKSGKLLATEENLQKLNSIGYGKVHIRADEKTGDLMYAFEDVNQDGVIDRYDEQDQQSYLNWINSTSFGESDIFGKAVLNFDIDKHARDIGNNLDPGFAETIKGYYKTGKTREADDLLLNFWLDQNQLDALKIVDPGKDEDQYNQEYRERIKSYITKKETKDFLGSKYSSDSRASSSKKDSKPKELIYTSTDKDGTSRFTFSQEAGGKAGIRLDSVTYNPKTDAYSVSYRERKKLPPDIEKQVEGLDQRERKKKLRDINPNLLTDHYESKTTTNEEEVMKILGTYLGKNSTDEILNHLEGLVNKKGIRKRKEEEVELPVFEPEPEPEPEKEKSIWDKAKGFFGLGD